MKLKHLLGCLFSCAAVVSLASCDSENDNKQDGTQDVVEAKLTGITVSGAKADFKVGDTFESTGLVVTAKYSDDTTKDVTANAKVTQAADMSKAGSYAVVVTYEGYNAVYQITVAAPENVKTLKKITANTTNVDLDYNVGDTLALAYLTLTLRYDNSTLEEDTLEIVSDLSAYTITVTDPSGEVVEGAFKTIGTHEVTISKDGFSASYEVNVKKEILNLTSVGDALEVALDNADLVNGGTVAYTSYNYDSNGYATEEYDYKFGNGFSVIEEDGITNYYTLLDAGTDYEDIFAVQYNSYSELYSIYNEAVLEDLNGYKVYSFMNYKLNPFVSYDAEDLICKLYEIGTAEDTLTTHGNAVQKFEEKDVKYCSECGNATYSFYMEVCTDEYYYTIVNASFELNDYNAMDNVCVSIETYYEDEIQMVYDEWDMDFDGDYTEFLYWQPSKANTSKNIYEFNQNIGPKATKNPYSPEIICASDFDLVDVEEKVYGEANADGNYDAVQIKTGIASALVLNIDNLAPKSANLDIDKVQIYYGEGGTADWSSYVYAKYEDGVLTIRGTNVSSNPEEVATEYVYIKSFFVEKVIKVEVTEVGPSSTITPQVLGTNMWGEEEFVEGTTITAYLGSSAYFNAAFDSNSLTEYTAALKETYTGVTLEETEYTAGWNTQDCYALNATAAGTYVVVLTYTANPELKAEITIDVVTPPTLADIISTPLIGKQGSMMGSVAFTLMFTPNTNPNTGSLSVKKVESSMYGDSSTVNASYTYSYDETTKSFTLTETTETGLEIEVSINNTYKVTVFDTMSYNTVTLDEFSLIGAWEATYTHPRLGEATTYLELYEDGTGSAINHPSGVSATFTYTIKDNVITFVTEEGVEISTGNTATLNADLTLSLDVNGLTIVYSKL